MLVDVKTELLLLNVPPEDYTVNYRFELNEPSTSIVYSIVEFLLTGSINKDGSFSSSIIDFFIFKELADAYGVRINYTPKAIDIIKVYLSQYEQVLKLKNGDFNDQIKTTLKSPLFSDQKAAVAFLLARGRAGNFSSVGIGKTITALGVFNTLKNCNKIDDGLVFILNETKLGWEDELKKHTNYSFKIVGNGTQNVLRDIDEFNEDLLVVHYDALTNQDVCVALANKFFDLWIVDEVHTLVNMDITRKNPKTGQKEFVCRRATAVRQLNEVMKPTYIIALSATPIPEVPPSAYGFLKLLKPEIIPDRKKFESHFCNYFQMPVKGKKFKINVINKKNPYKNLPQLKNLLELWSYRITHADVKDFPPTNLVPKRFELSDEQREIYTRIEEETFRDIAQDVSKLNNIEHVLVKTLRLRQFLSHPKLLGEKVQSTKFKVLDQMLDEILQDKSSKIVVFSPHRQTLDMLHESYKDKGSCIFVGVDKDYDTEDRNQELKKFLHDPEHRLLFANTALGTGGNWGVARTCIFLDLPVKRGAYKQALGRITRRNSIGTSVIIPFICKDTVDEVLWDNIQRKEMSINEILSPDDEILLSKEEILESLNRKIKNARKRK